MSLITPSSVSMPSSRVMLAIVVLVAVAVKPRMVFTPNFSFKTCEKKNLFNMRLLD